MAILSWGKPKVEIGVSTAGATASSWTVLPEIVEKTAQLTTEKGAKVEAKGEGGELIDSRNEKNKYKFEAEIFVKKGDSKPIADVDGTITAKYSVRLTPEDDTLEGWLIDNSSVSVEETWSSDKGKNWKYTFDGLKPATGTILKAYTKAP